IAESSRIAANIATYTLHHHEWWDGTGYPHGLKGTEIPLLSRVISIADAYDAMTHDRPYRKAMSEKAAIAELERCSGTQFDPELVPIFISVVNT
ncbi:MAG TPA: HD domain-containing phosphohydrolase, partial [Thermotogota bacterium]|nr:HD domain-containing phosphohydrolase [Thermotogota bacterium]